MFTGDTLFLNDIGRPDLAVKSDVTTKELAELLYESLHKEILTLPNNVVIYPGHGEGSPSGKYIAKGLASKIGFEK